MQMCEVQLRAGSYTPYQTAAVFPQMTQRKVYEIFLNFIFQTRGMSLTLASYVDAVCLTKSDRKVFGAQKEELGPSDKKVASSKVKLDAQVLALESPKFTNNIRVQQISQPTDSPMQLSTSRVNILAGI